MEKKTPERQIQAKKYLDEYDIENVISEMLNSLLHEKDPHPYVYMIKYLASLMTEDERKEFNLEIPEPYPTAHPVVKYPHFSDSCKNLLKKYLNRDSFLKLKKIKTKFGNNINSMTKLTELLPDDKIGCILSDGDCINSYYDFLIPIIDEAHKINSKKLDEYQINSYSKIFNCDLGLNELKGYLKKLIFSFSRNVQEFPFNNFSAGNNKIAEVAEFLQSQIEDKIGQGSLPQMKKYELSKNKDEIDNILKKINFNEKWMISANLKQSWPENRFVYISNDNSIIILINFCDHLQVLKLFNENDLDIEKGYNELIEIIQQLSLVITFETHKQYGYLTTNINLIGDGFKILSDIILKNTDKLPIEGSNINEFLNGCNFDDIVINKEGNDIHYITSNSCKLSMKMDIFINLYINQLAGMSKLFNNNKEGKKISFDRINLQDSKDIVFQNIKDAYEETFDEIKYNLSSSGTNINNRIEPVFKGYIPNNLGILFKDKSEYLSFSPFVRNYLLKSQGFDINIKEHIHGKEENYNLVSIEGEELNKIESLHVYLFRNIDGFSFPSSKDNSNDQIEKLIKEAIVNINSKEKIIEYYSLTENKTEAEKIIKENKLIFHCEELVKGGIDSDFPKNRGILKFLNFPYIFGVVNDICHIKFCISMQNPKEKMSPHLVHLVKMNNEFFRYLKFNYNKQIGFMTASPIYLGTGMRIELKMKLNKLRFEDVKKKLENTEFVAENNNDGIVIINKITIGESETYLLCKLLENVKNIIKNDL